MTKLLLDATVLREMLERQPEIEVELIRNASAQIAEVLKRKINEQKSEIYDNAVKEINSRLNYKYHLPEQVLRVIQSAVDDRIERFNAEQAQRLATEAFIKAVSGYEKKLSDRLDGIITEAVEKKVKAVFAQAAKLR